MTNQTRRPDPATDPHPAPRSLARLLTIAGVIGLLASFTLTVERIQLYQDPGHRPSCSINPILSCGSVMTHWQASLFGFPNPLLGIAGFAAVAATGAALLAGARPSRWFWLSLQAGALAGLALICWLISQSLYAIGALCPYCMVVWAAIFPLAWYLTLHNLRTGTIPLPPALRKRLQAAARWHWLGPLTWYAVLLFLIADRFWYYWRTVI